MPRFALRRLSSTHITPTRLQPDLPKAADIGQPIRMIHPTMCGVGLPCKSRGAGRLRERSPGTAGRRTSPRPAPKITRSPAYDAGDPKARAARDRGSFASVGGFQGGITPRSGLISTE